MKSENVLTAFIFGAAIGAALGMLLAPEKGSETRARLREQGLKIVDDLDEIIASGKTQLQDLANSVMENIVDKMDDGAEKTTL
ncbi:MAG: YtxH domain-containing protein [Bacteroidota bacterium]|nr:YtxH domain-containing protein [Bacteroidota bacterium]